MTGENENSERRSTRGRRANGAAGDNLSSDPGLFTVDHWLERDLPPPDYLLGDLLSTTTRALLVGPTGSGKTNFGMALNFAIARGAAFLHWRARRPARKLVYVDGEMSARLARERLRQAVERHGAIPDNLILINRDDFPMMPPLNTVEGQRFANCIIAQVGAVEFVTFDNVQSLLLGDMKEEESWRDTLPWIRDLTRRGIGQLWIHHTGHHSDRAYGTKTREWQLDTVMLMKQRERQDGRLISFDLEFSKARERTPDNRRDFTPAHVWLGEDHQWHSSIETAKKKKVSSRRPSPMGEKYYNALVDEIGRRGQRRTAIAEAPLAVTRQQWREAAIRHGLIGADAPANVKTAKISKYQAELVAADWVRVEGDWAWPIRHAAGRKNGTVA